MVQDGSLKEFEVTGSWIFFNFNTIMTSQWNKCSQTKIKSEKVKVYRKKVVIEMNDTALIQMVVTCRELN